MEALRADRELIEIRLAPGVQPAVQAEIRSLAGERGVPVKTADRTQLDAITDRHQGVLARAAQFPYVSPAEILARAAERSEPPLIVISDGLQDPQNLGTLIRTLEAVGGHGLIVPKHRAAGITPGAIKASAGAVQWLSIARATNIARAIDELREQGVWVAGLDGRAKGRLRDLPATDGLALVIGSEGEGLSRLVRERCDLLVALPTAGRLDSLNAAVAGSIALYDVWRRRQGQ